MGRVRYAAAALLVVGLLAGCGDDPPPRGRVTTPVAGAAPAAAEASTSEYGVRVAITVGYAEDRVLDDVRLVWAGGSTSGSSYPVDVGYDSDHPPEPVPVAAGTQVLLEGTVLAPCPDTPSRVVFEVRSTGAGGPRTDRHPVDDEDTLGPAFAAWCRRSPTVWATGGSETPEGDYRVSVAVSNPGPETVRVESDAVDDGETSWRAAAVVVPAGTITSLTIRGHGPSQCATTPPWEDGHLRVDGRPVRPTVDDWC
ncbi:hypothetical protein [Nocardioides kongjuensis]|uniref:Uncharacterized protein n=2 Tax=Nocardioides kongjuensis TaxID=349522 RepID=A0A852RGE9_9ACTN|nr:hypothetical protein [Nocardioides kongjuensis]NYD32641.1 hypothetical protein [Nocardioides kongjuensis]